MEDTPLHPHGQGPPLGPLRIWGEGLFPVRSRAGGGRKPMAAWSLTPLPPADVIHTVGPIAHGEPSASQAAELRSCYLSSLDLLLEHRLRSAVRGAGEAQRGRKKAPQRRRLK